MAIQRCDQCDKPVDTDVTEMESFACGEDDSFSVCPGCAEKILAAQEQAMRAARAEYHAAPLSERNPTQYRQDMIDAGRGHLLPEHAERMNEMADMERKRRREEPST
jgi:hypothetical protein